MRKRTIEPWQSTHHSCRSMQAWLPVYDKALHCLQNSDRPQDLLRILKQRCFPADWIPDDSTSASARKPLYPCSTTSAAVLSKAPGGAGVATQKPKLRNRSLLMHAVRLGRLESVQCLLGAPLFCNPATAAAWDGNTSAHLAVIHGMTQILQVLLFVLGPACLVWKNRWVRSK